MSEMFSPDSLSRRGLKFVDAFIDQACVVQASGPDHVCGFVLEGSSDQAVADAFRPFPVEVKTTVSWGKFLGTTT
jgi:hypothetical protein